MKSFEEFLTEYAIGDEFEKHKLMLDYIYTNRDIFNIETTNLEPVVKINEQLILYLKFHNTVIVEYKGIEYKCINGEYEGEIVSYIPYMCSSNRILIKFIVETRTRYKNEFDNTLNR